MDSGLRSITDWLRGVLAGWMGRDAERPILGSLSATDLGVVLFYVGITLCCCAGVAVYLRHRSKHAAATGGSAAELHPHVISAIGKPLYALIIVYGVYVAATPILLKLRPEQGSTAARGLLNALFETGALIALFWLLFRATYVVQARLAAWPLATASQIDDLLAPLIGTILRVCIIVVAVILALPLLQLPPAAESVVDKLTSISLIVGLSILLVRAVTIGKRLVLNRFDISAEDNLRARQVYTQINLISRIIYVGIGFFAVAATLMLFQEVRHVGTSLLASAGIVGIIAGFAAQKTLANVFAGFQIALAQPVRQDDVVIVEGEWGRIEEITLSFIVVKIWDERRLVVPLSYFIEKPFQNWTRSSAELMGSVFIWVDYNFPVEQGRVALQGIIESSSLWDRRFWNLQVSDASEKTLQLRILATASNSSRSWDLRCEIREKFLAFIQQSHPESLPRIRMDIPAAELPP